MNCKVAAMNCYEKEINELELRIKDLRKKSERIDKRKKFGFFYPDVDEPYYVYAVDEIMDFERPESVPESDEFFEDQARIVYKSNNISSTYSLYSFVKSIYLFKFC